MPDPTHALVLDGLHQGQTIPLEPHPRVPLLILDQTWYDLIQGESGESYLVEADPAQLLESWLTPKRGRRSLGVSCG